MCLPLPPIFLVFHQYLIQSTLLRGVDDRLPCLQDRVGLAAQLPDIAGIDAVKQRLVRPLEGATFVS